MTSTVLTLKNGKTITGLAGELRNFLKDKDMYVQCLELKDASDSSDHLPSGYTS